MDFLLLLLDMALAHEHLHRVIDDLGSRACDLNGWYGNDMLPFGVPYPHRGLDLILRSDILDMDYLLRLRQLQALGDLVHHLLAGADYQDFLVLLLQQSLLNLLPVPFIIEDSGLHGYEEVRISFC